MTIKQIYALAIELGVKYDLRGPATVQRKLRREKEKFNKLPQRLKGEYDVERLANPFSDTRYFSDNPGKPVRRVLAGIDIETSELLLAKEISKDTPVDLVLSHHPIGPALAGLHEVMHLQAELLALYGVPINVAENLITIRLDEVSRIVSPINHSRVLDAARLLKLDLMCAHTATDNLVAHFLDRLLKKGGKRVEFVEDIMKILKTVPEYRLAMAQKAGPMIFTGAEDRYAGKIALTEVTGGTAGSKHMYEKLSQAGIGTIIGMHMQEEYKREAEKHHLNVIIAGHMSSDSIGMNLFLDELEKRGVEVLTCSGLTRVRRFRVRKSSRAGKKKK